MIKEAREILAARGKKLKTKTKLDPPICEVLGEEALELVFGKDAWRFKKARFSPETFYLAAYPYIKSMSIRKLMEYYCAGELWWEEHNK